MFVNFNILNQLGSPAINSNTFANRPAAGQTGRLFVSTDTYEIYRDNGTTWDLIGGPGSSTITGTGTATQVAYFTSSQAIGSSANLFWDNTSGFLGVATATPSARIEAVKTDGVGIYANFTTNAGSGSSTTALWAKNVTNSSGFAAVIEETTPNTTAGQYPLLIKHSLSSGTAGVGMGTGLHFQLPDDAGTFKTTQLTIETIDAAAATYKTRYRFNVQNNGTGTPVAYINATGIGIFTATPGAALDVHSTGTIAQFNTTSATGNTYIAFQRTGSGLWRIGDTYNAGNNFFELHNTVLGVDAMEFEAATNKSTFQAQQTYTTGLARGNYFDYNLSVAAGGSFSSPNAITPLTATLDLTLAGNATIPSGARSGLDAYNTIAFTGAGTLTHNQGTQIRAYSNVTAGWAFNGSAVGTITHLAGLRALFPDNSGSAVNVTNNYALLLNDQTANTGTVTYTNRWGIYQEGSSDINYMAANLLLGTTTNTSEKLRVVGTSYFSSNVGIGDAPTFMLDVKTSALTVARFLSNASGKRNNILLQNNANYNYGVIGVVSATGTITGDVYGLGYSASGSVAFTEVLNWTSTGLVGIGITTPAARLNVNLGTNTDAVQTITRFGANNLAGELKVLDFQYQGSSNLMFLKTQAVGTDPNLVFAVGSTEVFRTTSGNVLIGTTTNAGQKLQVNGNARFTDTIQTIDNTVSNGYLTMGSASGAAMLPYFECKSEASSIAAYFGISRASNQSAITGYSDSAFLITTDFTATTGNLFRVDNNGSVRMRLSNGGKLLLEDSIQTGAPTGGTSAEWKLGSRVAATVVLDTTQYIELQVGATTYKLAIVT